MTQSEEIKKIYEDSQILSDEEWFKKYKGTVVEELSSLQDKAERDAFARGVASTVYRGMETDYSKAIEDALRGFVRELWDTFGKNEEDTTVPIGAAFIHAITMYSVEEALESYLTKLRATGGEKE